MLTNTLNAEMFDLALTVYDETGGWPVEDFYLFKIPKKLGVHPLVPTQPYEDDGQTGAFYYTLSDQGDVLEEVYILETSATDNQVDVTFFKNNEAAGYINATFIIDPDRGKRNPLSPDTVRITDGEFYLKF